MWRCLQNEDGVEIILADYKSLIRFVLREELFCFEGRALELAASYR